MSPGVKYILSLKLSARAKNILINHALFSKAAIIISLRDGTLWRAKNCGRITISEIINYFDLDPDDFPNSLCKTRMEMLQQFIYSAEQQIAEKQRKLALYKMELNTLMLQKERKCQRRPSPTKTSWNS